MAIAATPITNSFATVISSSMGNYLSSSHYVSMGGCLFRRKFDQSVIPSNWVELWVGYMYGMNLSYSGSSSTANDWYFGDDESSGTITASFFSWGLNHSSGSPYWDTIIGPAYSDVSTYCSHSLMCKHATVAPFYVTGSSAGNILVQPNAIAYCVVNNFQGVGKTNAAYMWIPASPNQWRYQLFQFKRTNVIDYATTMSISHTKLSTTETVEPANESLFSTSSALLAEAMKQPTYALAVSKLGGNYSNTSLGTINIDELTNGIFDEFFFSWQSMSSPWRVTNIMIRASGSF